MKRKNPGQGQSFQPSEWGGSQGFAMEIGNFPICLVTQWETDFLSYTPIFVPAQLNSVSASTVKMASSRADAGEVGWTHDNPKACQRTTCCSYRSLGKGRELLNLSLVVNSSVIKRKIEMCSKMRVLKKHFFKATLKFFIQQHK